MENKQLIITTSWDDGHPLDLKIAELLDKYGINGTFYSIKKCGIFHLWGHSWEIEKFGLWNELEKTIKRFI